MNPTPDHPAEPPETAMQKAIRARALQTVQRRPARFWFSSPPRFIAAVFVAMLLVALLVFAIDRGLRAFRTILDLFLSPPNATAPEPDVKQPQMIYLPPAPDAPPPPEPTPPPESPPP